MTTNGDWWKNKKARDGAAYQEETFTRLRAQHKRTGVEWSDKQDYPPHDLSALNRFPELKFTIDIAEPVMSQFVNAAQQRARQAYLLGFRTWHHEYAVSIADVRIQLDGRKVHVKITPPETFYFEFFTSGNPVVTDVTDTTIIPFTRYAAAVVGVNVHSDGTSDPKIMKGKRATNTIPNSPLGRPAQLTLVDEPTNYPTKDRKTLLYESYAPLHSHTGVWLRAFVNLSGWEDAFSTTYRYGPYRRGELDSFTARDIDFDIPYQYGEGNAAATRAYIRGDADWPRANAIHEVKSEQFGKRTFGIYNDAFGQFWFFPLSKIGPPGDPYSQNVPAEVVKLHKPVLPTWVWQSAKSAAQWWAEQGTNAVVDFQEIDWKFRQDGKCACAVVFERRAATFDTAYFNAAIGPTPVDITKFENYRDYHTGALTKNMITFAVGYSTQRYSVAPGVVEVEFNVILTGWGDDEFVVQSVVREIRRPTSTAYFTMLAGYAWHDIKAKDWTKENQHFDARAGDMVVLDQEINSYYDYHANSDFVENFRIDFLSLKNLTQDKELRTFPPTGPWNVPPDYASTLRLLDCDLPTLSFVFKLGYRQVETVVVADVIGGSPPTYPTRKDTEHFGAFVVVLNRVQDRLYPESMPAYAKAALEYRAGLQGREVMLATKQPYLLLRLDTIQGWGYSDYAQARLHSMQAVGAKGGAPVAQASPVTRSLFQTCAYSFSDSYGALLITDPCLGWRAYGAVFVDAFQSNQHSVFFVHPTGSWAFYDQQQVYNLNGATYPVMRVTSGPLGLATDTYTPLKATLFEHVIFDRVHFVTTRGVKANTSFRALYNKAVVKGTKDKTLVDEFLPIAMVDLRANFTVVPYVYAPAPYGVNVTAAVLRVAWGGGVGYLLDGVYTVAAAAGAQVVTGDQFGLIDASLGGIFVTAPGGSTIINLNAVGTPIKFSSCAMIRGRN